MKRLVRCQEPPSKAQLAFYNEGDKLKYHAVGVRNEMYDLQYTLASSGANDVARGLMFKRLLEVLETAVGEHSEALEQRGEKHRRGLEYARRQALAALGAAQLLHRLVPENGQIIATTADHFTNVLLHLPLDDAGMPGEPAIYTTAALAHRVISRAGEGAWFQRDSLYVQRGPEGVSSAMELHALEHGTNFIPDLIMLSPHIASRHNAPAV